MRGLRVLSVALMLSAAGATSAMAADTTVNWTGFYVGAHLGDMWGDSNVNIPNYPSNFTINLQSLTAGVQAGGNYQFDENFLVGLEGDVSYLNEANHKLTGGINNEEFFVRYDWRTSIRVRAGITTGPALFYVTGGWVATDLSQARYTGSGSQSYFMPNGLTFGAGIDYAFDDNWSFGAEYLHDEFGHKNFVYGGPTQIGLKNNTIRLRLNYLFGEAPPPSPPPAAPPPPPPPPPPPAPVKTFIVFFDFDKSNLTAEAQSVVEEAVKSSKANGMVKVLITGHTDTVGSDSYNQGLSVRRAETVKDEMVHEGMDGSSISIEGKSFHDPLVPTGPGVREPQNRRAVIDLGGG